jgi:hypothetical protein
VTPFATAKKSLGFGCLNFQVSNCVAMTRCSTGHPSQRSIVFSHSAVLL